MSELRVDSVKSKGGGAPDLPKGVTISGITTAVTLGATQIDVSNVNVSGVVTSGTLSGSLLSTGTPTLGLGVTINSSGVVISGVATAGIVSATTLYGDGTNLTGVGASIAPLFYNPDVSDGSLGFTATGIGITFNQQIKAGTGNITLRLVGAAGTVVENFGVGSSVTISENKVSFTPTDTLANDTVYHISYPSGCFTNNEGTDYVGTAYTFATRDYLIQAWVTGFNSNGILGLNQSYPGLNGYSSPVQLPGTTWDIVRGAQASKTIAAMKTDGTLWAWGRGDLGQLGNSDRTEYSSPIQIPGTTWNEVSIGYQYEQIKAGGTKTDGTLWMWGQNQFGQLAQNNTTKYSSPVQVGSNTTWQYYYAGGFVHSIATKTDGTLWVWGKNNVGCLGLSQSAPTAYSSPVQVPGTTWQGSRFKLSSSSYNTMAIKTDGTLWMWGQNEGGQLGQNEGPAQNGYSSPVQIPGTTWDKVANVFYNSYATKTDGTLWAWGNNDSGALGQNESGENKSRSSPTQIPGTTWDKIRAGTAGCIATKTDNTLWAWGNNTFGRLGDGTVIHRSSPVQIPGSYINISSSESSFYLIKQA